VRPDFEGTISLYIYPSRFVPGLHVAQDVAVQLGATTFIGRCERNRIPSWPVAQPQRCTAKRTAFHWSDEINFSTREPQEIVIAREVAIRRVSFPWDLLLWA
jgi:hypothetical protein